MIIFMTSPWICHMSYVFEDNCSRLECENMLYYRTLYLRVARLTASICKPFIMSPGIDSQPGGIDSSEAIPGLLKRLQIRALQGSL